MNLVEPIAHLRNELVRQPRHRLAVRLTCLFLLLNGFVTEGPPTINLPVQVLCLFMLLADAFLMLVSCWFLLAMIMTLLLVPHWSVYDNHKFLIVYWGWTCLLTAGQSNKEEFLGSSARLLVGSVFGLAVVWKLASGDYLNGDFFHFTFLQDTRFLNLTVVGGGIELPVVMQNHQNLEWMKLFPGTTITATLQTSFQVRLLAWMACYTTLAIEVAVCLSFFKLGPGWLTRRNDIFLLSFLIFTLLSVPVHGFASILAILGLAQVRPDRPGLRLAYLAIFLYVQIAILLPNWLNVFRMS